MFKHDKQLLEMVRVERPNPTYAVMLQEQLGGPQGELKAAMQYISQSFRIKDQAIKDVFMDIAADLLSNIAAEQRAKVVYEYLHRQINDRHVRQMIDFLLNREEAHNTMFRECFQKIQDTGSNRDWGVDEDSRLYFNLSRPGNYVGSQLHSPNPPSFTNPQNPSEH